MNIFLSKNNLSTLSIDYNEIKYTRLIKNRYYTIKLPIQSDKPEVSAIQKLSKLSSLDDDSFLLFAKSIDIPK